jgi:hypothetical protein
MLGNTNLTLVNYNNTANNESEFMKYVDIDGDSNTKPSGMAELSNSGEKGSNQNWYRSFCRTFHWTENQTILVSHFQLLKVPLQKDYEMVL